MVQRPDVYDKNPVPPHNRLRFWVGLILVLGSLIAAGWMLWNLRARPLPPADVGATSPRPVAAPPRRRV